MANNASCDCINKVASNLKEHLTEKGRTSFKNYQFIDGEWKNRCFYPNNKLYAEYKYSYQFDKVNGEPSKPKSETVNIFFTYCPFCGTKIDKDDEKNG